MHTESEQKAQELPARTLDDMRAGDRIRISDKVSCRIISIGERVMILETYGSRITKLGRTKNRFEKSLVGKECNLCGVDFKVTRVVGKRVIITRK